MVAQKRKPTRKNPPTRTVEEQPVVAHANAEPAPTGEARVLAQVVRNNQDRRDIRFEVKRGVLLMFGYNGLCRIAGVHYVHIATVAEITAMSDQQIYDAVMRAGGKR